jgi:hypothetical protein
MAPWSPSRRARGRRRTYCRRELRQARRSARRLAGVQRRRERGHQRAVCVEVRVHYHMSNTDVTYRYTCTTHCGKSSQRRERADRLCEDLRVPVRARRRTLAEGIVVQVGCAQVNGAGREIDTIARMSVTTMRWACTAALHKSRRPHLTQHRSCRSTLTPTCDYLHQELRSWQ